MSKFTDAQGRAWTIVLNIGVLRRVKAESGIDLGGFFEQEVFTRLFITDSLLIGEVLCAICRPNFPTHGIDEDAFYAGLNGDSILEGRKALEEAFRDFCPSQDRARVEMVFKALATQIETAKKMATEALTGFLETAPEPSGEPSPDAPVSSE